MKIPALRLFKIDKKKMAFSESFDNFRRPNKGPRN